jgi:predicted TIM-barrel fold metal-dependent hydrolase
MDTAARYRIMFASDWPVFRAIYDEKDYVEVFTKRARGLGFEFTDEELNLFFGENVQDYLDLNL